MRGRSAFRRDSGGGRRHGGSIAAKAAPTGLRDHDIAVGAPSPSGAIPAVGAATAALFIAAKPHVRGCANGRWERRPRRDSACGPARWIRRRGSVSLRLRQRPLGRQPQLEGLDVRDQPGQIVPQDAPDRVVVDAQVGMNDPVPGCDDLSPGYTRRKGADLFRNVFGRPRRSARACAAWRRTRDRCSRIPIDPCRPCS